MKKDLKKQIQRQLLLSFLKVRDDFIFEMNGKQFREYINTAQEMGIEETAREILRMIGEMKIENPVVAHNSYGEGFDFGFNEAISGIEKEIKNRYKIAEQNAICTEHEREGCSHKIEKK